MASSKDVLVRVLAALGLVAPAVRVHERRLARRQPRHAPTPDVGLDGLPLPPREVMYAVTGSVDHDWFIESGVLAVQSLCEILARHGTNLDSMSAVLEFGCGCGRALRHLHYLPGRLSGCDWNRQSIRWCRKNLPFADFADNRLAPPLPYPDDSFDLVYALSVFTHMGEDLQRPWMREVSRVVKPGGLVALSTAGHYHKDRLSSVECRRFDRGVFVVRREEGSGTNLCSAFHPEGYLRGAFTRGFRLLEIVAGGALGNPRQDLTLLQRPEGERSGP